MTRTISQLYRLAFFIFYIWAMFESAVLQDAGFLSAFSNLPLLADTLCFFIVTAVFICSVIGKIPQALLKIKAAVTALALLVLVLSFPMFFSPEASGWILKILLPAMMILDWLLFDKKGTFRVFDPLFWLLAILLLFLLWSLIANRGISLLALTNFFGGSERLLSTLLTLITAGALMYGLDKLFSQKGALRPRDMFCLLYRIFFLILTGHALYTVSSENLINLVFSLKRFSVLSAFLCFLCIAVVLIFSLLRLRSFHSQTPFPRVKGAFTLFAAVTCIGYHFFIMGGTPQDSVNMILLYISPIMMIFDWILFDTKGRIKPFDPLWWAALPAIYAIVLLILKEFFPLYPALARFSTELFFCGGFLTLLAIGYGIYLLDLALKHK